MTVQAIASQDLSATSKDSHEPQRQVLRTRACRDCCACRDCRDCCDCCDCRDCRAGRPGRSGACRRARHQHRNRHAGLFIQRPDGLERVGVHRKLPAQAAQRRHRRHRRQRERHATGTAGRRNAVYGDARRGYRRLERRLHRQLHPTAGGRHGPQPAPGQFVTPYAARGEQTGQTGNTQQHIRQWPEILRRVGVATLRYPRSTPKDPS